MIEEPEVNLSLNRTSPDHDFLGKARQMHRGDRRSRQRFEHEIAIRDRIERIGHRAIEAQRLGGGVAINRE
jgi:hypothetical protein